MNHFHQQEQTSLFFDDTVIAIRYRGRCFGVLSAHQTCIRGVGRDSSVTSVLASDRDALQVADWCCDACGQSLVNQNERVALERFCNELSAQVSSRPEYQFQWNEERSQYHAKYEQEIVVVSFGLMANTIFKCLHANLDVKIAFDAREWERGSEGSLRFIVLKKRHALPQITGWMMWKDGRPYGTGICESKRRLLIGYDMISLRGLERTEAVLSAEGIEARRSLVVVSPKEVRDCYAATINGRFDLAALEYSICNQEEDRVFTSLAGYYGRDRAGYTPDRQRVLSDAEGQVCERYWWFMVGGFYKDGRRKTTYVKLRRAVEEIFAAHCISIVPIRYHCLDASAMGHGQV